MIRIVRGRSAELSYTFYVDGNATDPTPDSASVSITRADGSTLTPSASVDNSGVGVVSITLTPSETANLDRLTVTWSAVFDGQTQSFTDTVEIVGDFLFTIAEARAAIGDPAYDADRIVDARTYAETELEGALGYALVPRYTHTTVVAQRGMPLRLQPYTTVVRSATSNGTVLTSGDLAALSFNAGFVSGYWWSGAVTVGYEHGLPVPSPGAKRAALALALDELDAGSASSIDPRASQIVTVDGTVNLRAGSGQFFAAGVNEWISANRLPAIA
jgi:hypothetical protein